MGSTISGRVLARSFQPIDILLKSEYYESINEIIFEICEDESEGGFVARALGYSIVTQAETWEELRANVRDAVRCHFEEGKAPRVIRLHPVLDEVLALHEAAA